MFTTILIAANMCLQGDQQVDVSRYVDPAASRLELKVTMESATGTLVVYSPGYEDQPARLSGAESSASIPFARPVLCLRAIGGPFDFNIQIKPIDNAHRPAGAPVGLRKQRAPQIKVVNWERYALPERPNGARE